jgi:hypothetical protein
MRGIQATTCQRSCSNSADRYVITSSNYYESYNYLDDLDNSLMHLWLEKSDVGCAVVRSVRLAANGVRGMFEGSHAK